MRIVILLISLFVALLILLVILFTAANATCDPTADASLYGGTYSGPGSLGGVLGTGVTAKEITAARKHAFGGTTIVPNDNYVATAYAPSAGGINCGAGCGSTASGIRVDAGKRRAYIVASNPMMNKYGAFAYIWPNPYGWKGPFIVADTGGNFDGSDGSHRVDFYIFGDREAQAKANAWGRQRVRVSREPIATLMATHSSDTLHLRYAADVRSSTTPSMVMARPTTGPITSPFGERWGRLHAGIDIAPPAGTPIVAALAGEVIYKGAMSGYGNYTCIRHAPTLTTCYAHQQRFATSIRVGEQVARAQTIGYVGNTGNSTGPHLHFEVRRGPDYSSPPVDPAPYVNGAESVTPLADPGASSQCQVTLSAASGVYAWPIAGAPAGVSVIGRPGEGTHSFTAPPNNWQSDNAIDIAVNDGMPAVAVDDGVISEHLGFGEISGDRESRFAGIRLHLVDAHGNTWYYAHLSRVVVKPGDQVRRGQLLGNSGTANGVAHLHIAAKDGDPAQLLGVAP